MAKPEIAVVIVTYNSRHEIDACLESVFAQTDLPSSPQVIVVDNASPDGTADHIRRRWPQVTLLAERENRGFAAGNNLGLRSTDADRLLLLNPDTIMRPGALAALDVALDRLTKAGIVGPRLLNPDGTLQSSCRDFPRLFTDFVGMTEAHRLPWVHRWLAQRTAAMGDHNTQRRVDWLSGACLYVRQAAIDAAGPLDEGYFMYTEEMEWQYRMAQQGWQVWFVPAAEVVHIGGASTAAVPGPRIVWQYTSIFRFYRQYAPLWQRWALRGIVWVATLPKLLYLGLRKQGNPRRQELFNAFKRILWL